MKKAPDPIRWNICWKLLLYGLMALAGLSFFGGDLHVAAGDRAWLADRSYRRELRVRFQEQLDEDRALRAELCAEVVGGLIAFAEDSRAPGQVEVLNQMLCGLMPLNAEELKPLLARVEQRSAMAEDHADEARERWQRRLEKDRGTLLRRPVELLDRSLSLGALDVAWELVNEIRAIDPDYEPIRRKLGETKIDGRWLSKFAAEQWQQGLVWDERLGWVRKDERGRYERGEYFDLRTQSWTTVPRANQAHALLSNPWMIRTEHLELRGTVDLEVMVEAANQLGSFYQVAVATFPRFFVKEGRHRDLLLGTADHQRLTVCIYRSKEQYSKVRPDAVSWSSGIYQPFERTSFFFDRNPRIKYHEFTHSMLHIFSGDNQSPAWLTEGVAVYCESPQRRFGRLILGGIEANPLVQNYLAAFRRGRHVPLEDLLRLKTFTDWTGTHDPKPQYEAAGALVCFCMEARGRQYRADFIDYLRDSYRGTTEGHELWEYLGWNQPTLAAHFEAWLSEVSRNSAEQTSGGN